MIQNLKYKWQDGVKGQRRICFNMLLWNKKNTIVIHLAIRKNKES